jgi:hypothetical protein
MSKWIRPLCSPRRSTTVGSGGVHSLRSVFQTEFVVYPSATLRGFKMTAKTQSTLLGEHRAGNIENSTIIRTESTVFSDFPDSMTASSGTTVIAIRDLCHLTCGSIPESDTLRLQTQNGNQTLNARMQIMPTAGVRDLILRESTSQVRVGVGGTRRNVNGEIYTFAQPIW